MSPAANEPRPQCPECGCVLRPQQNSLVAVSHGSEEVPNDEIPEGLELDAPFPDVYAGIYCCEDCVIDAFERGWPEFRCMTQ